MSGSKLELSDRPALERLARIVGALRTAGAPEPLLVGAAARDLLLHHVHAIPLARATRDVDLAVALDDWPAFERLRNALLAQPGFTSVKGVEHRVRHVEWGDVDLVPFGAVEGPLGAVAWPPRGEPVLNVLGFREAASTSRLALLPRGERVRVLELSMMALLKVLAFDDRHARVPRKDASDLVFLLRSYEAAGNEERIYTVAGSMLGKLDADELGAWLLGHDARELVGSCAGPTSGVVERVLRILERECDPDGPLRLVGDAEGSSPERRRRLLAAFTRGLADRG